MQTELPTDTRQEHKSEMGGGQLWPCPICRDSHSPTPAHSTRELKIPGSSHFSREARNLDVCVRCPNFLALATPFDSKQKHHAGQTQHTLRLTRPTGRQLESLVVSVCGSLGLQQACHARAWDKGLGRRRQQQASPRVGVAIIPAYGRARLDSLGARAVGIACRALPST